MNRYAFVAPIALVGFCLVISSAAVQASSSRNWEGLYLGGHAGYGEVDVGANVSEYSYSDGEGYFLGGIYGGYNVHLDNGFVLGGEADLTLNNLEWKGFRAFDEDTYALLASESYELSWSGAIRARMGYAYKNLLPYAAIGLAAASVEQSFFSRSQTKTLTGLTLALGVDIATSDDLAMRVEYRYTDYGSADYDFAGLESVKNEIKSSELRLGVSYMF